MRALSMISVAIVIALSSGACSDSAVTAPNFNPAVRVPWGPLGTGNGGACGDTEVRMTNPDFPFESGPVALADDDDCPPPNFVCPQTLTVRVVYVGETFVGPGNLMSAGTGFGTYSYIAFDINPAFGPFDYYIAGTIQYTLWQCWRLSHGSIVTTSDFTIDEQELPPI